MQGKPVTSEEISRIKHLRLLGLSIYVIAKQVNRAPSFVYGHIRNLGLQSCLDRSQFKRGHEVSDEVRYKISEKNKGRKHSEEWKMMMSRKTKKQWKNPEFRFMMSEAFKGENNPNYGKTFSEEHRRKLSEARKGKQPMKGKHHIESTKQQISKINEKLWKNSEYVRKQMRARNVKPNKAELRLLKLLQTISNDWRYVGDGKLILEGLCPDFTNGKGQLIELFGTYWHDESEEEERKALFKKVGFDTLIVWDSELDNVPVLSEKLMGFHSGEQS